jgi:hypothetical protein
LLWTACSGSDDPSCTPAAEACNGVDDDCDGQTGEVDALGCTEYARDVDQDGAGVAGDARCLCAAAAPYTAAGGGDCDDADASVRPGATESCDGVDEDCDAQTDEAIAGCCAPGAEQDCGVSQGACTVGTETCGAGFAWGPCLDAAGQPVVLPGGAESCNGLDDDCDGQTDEASADGCTTFYRDDDQDASGRSDDSRCLCAAAAPYSATAGGDCDDADAAVHPGAAELCNGGDDDCDGATADGAGDPALGAACDGSDGDLCAEGAYACSGGGLLCGDASGTSVEDCNGADDDCDGATDEDLAAPTCANQTGVCAGATMACGGASGWLACSAARYGPSYEATESSCDALDNDCDGSTDESLAQQCYTGPAATLGTGICTAGTRTCTGGAYGTCLGEVLPRAEACNGVDDDCDGATDEAGVQGCTTFHVDADADGYGGPTSACLCAPSPPYTQPQPGDCDDARATVHPGADERCTSGIDEDCDGMTDEAGCTP